NMSTPLFTFNLTRAASELGQTPYWTSGFNITLYYNAGNTERRQGCLLLRQGLQALHDQLGAGPISVGVRALDWPAYLGTLRARVRGYYYNPMLSGLDYHPLSKALG